MKTIAKQLSILLTVPFLLFSCKKDKSKEIPDNQKDYSAYVKLTSSQAKNVNIHKALLTASLDSIHNVISYSMGFLLFIDNTESEPVKLELENNSGEFELSIDTLKGNTTYYFTPYVVVKYLYKKDSFCYGDTNKFKTPARIFTSHESFEKYYFYDRDTISITGGVFIPSDTRVYIINKDKEYDMNILSVSATKIKCTVPDIGQYIEGYIDNIYIQSGNLLDYIRYDGDSITQSGFVFNYEFISGFLNDNLKPGSFFTIKGHFKPLNYKIVGEKDGYSIMEGFYKVTIGDSVINTRFRDFENRASLPRLETRVPKGMPEGKYALTVTTHYNVVLESSDSLTIKKSSK